MAEWDIEGEDNKDVLKRATRPKKSTPKKMGRPKAENNRTTKFISYYSEDEAKEIKDYCDGRSASSVIRKIVLDKIRET